MAEYFYGGGISNKKCASDEERRARKHAAQMRWNAKNKRRLAGYSLAWAQDPKNKATRNAASVSSIRKRKLADPTIGWNCPRGWAQSLLRSSAKSCYLRGLPPASITVEEIEAIWLAQGGRCAWSGVPLNTLRGHPLKVSLDRRDNSVGYQAGNVIIASWLMNNARRNMTELQFHAVIQAIAPGAITKVEVDR
jgi:hypothetical protein